MKQPAPVSTKEIPAWKVPGSEYLRTVNSSGEERIIYDPSLENIEVGKTHMGTTGTKFSMTSRESHDTWEKTMNDSLQQGESETVTIARSSAYLPALVKTVSGNTSDYFRSTYGVGGRRSFYIFSDGDRWVFVDKDTLAAINEAQKKGIAIYTSKGQKYSLYKYYGTETEEYPGECYIREQKTPRGVQRAVIAAPVRATPSAPAGAAPQVSGMPTNPLVLPSIKPYAIKWREEPEPETGTDIPALTESKMGKTGAIFTREYTNYLANLVSDPQFMNLIDVVRSRYSAKNGKIIGVTQKKAITYFRSIVNSKSKYLGSGTSADVFAIDNDPYADNANTAFKFATPVGFKFTSEGMRRAESVLHRYINMYEEVFMMLMIKGPYAPNIYYIVDELYDKLVQVFKTPNLTGAPLPAFSIQTENEMLQLLQAFPDNQPIVGYATDNYPGGIARPDTFASIRPADRFKKVSLFLRRAIAATLAIHEAGIVHGDISAANLMYDPTTDRVTVIDLQMALHVTLRDFRLSQSTRQRTVPYVTMAPWMGRTDDIRAIDKPTSVEARQWGDLWGIAIIAVMLFFMYDYTTAHDAIFPTQWKKRQSGQCTWLALITSPLINIARCAEALKTKIEYLLKFMDTFPTMPDQRDYKQDLINMLRLLLFVPYKLDENNPDKVISLEPQIRQRVKVLHDNYVSNLPPQPPLNIRSFSDVGESSSDPLELSPMSESTPMPESGPVDLSASVQTPASSDFDLSASPEDIDFEITPLPPTESKDIAAQSQLKITTAQQQDIWRVSPEEKEKDTDADVDVDPMELGARMGGKTDASARPPMGIQDLRKWMNEALVDKGATYVAIWIRPMTSEDFPSGETYAEQAGNPDAFADVYSITKSIFGLLVARAHMKYSKGQFPRERFNVMDTATSMMSKHGSVHGTINMAAAKVAEVRLNDMLTQTSGVETEPIDYSDIIKFQQTGGVDLAKWAADKVRDMRPTYLKGQSAPFKYDNVMTQMAEFAYAHRMRQIQGYERPSAWRGFTTKEEAMRTIFENVDMDIEWEEGAVHNPLLHSTMVFMGIKMTGRQLLKLGKYLVSDPDWRQTLEFIHGWEHAVTINSPEYENRKNWRYSFLWWIPNEADFDGMRYLVAIGLFGQYLVINLGTPEKPERFVAVRQHNVDVEDVKNLMLSPGNLDEHPLFVQHIHRIFMEEFKNK